MSPALQTLSKVVSVGFAGYTVVKTVKEAREDEDGLQLAEALLRGATLTLSLVLLIRELRSMRRDQGQLA
jgi:hypothetical protein